MEADWPGHVDNHKRTLQVQNHQYVNQKIKIINFQSPKNKTKAVGLCKSLLCLYSILLNF